MTDLNVINNALAQFDPFETENEKKVLARVISELIKDKEDRTKKRFKTEIKAKIKATNPIFCELGSDIVAVWKNATYATWESYPSWDDEPQSYYRVSRRLSDEPLFVADFTLDSEAEFDNFIAIFAL